MVETLRAPFPLLAAGALLFAVALAAFVMVAHEDMLGAAMLLIPLFGLPFLLLARRSGWKTALYFLLLVPAFHWAAVSIAMYSFDWHDGNLYVPGAAGGATGALLSFLALAALRLARPRPVATMAAGFVVLTILGVLGLHWMDAIDDAGVILSLYFPWQIAFAFFLARLLRDPPRAATD